MNKSILFVLALFSFLTAFPQNDSILFAGEPHFKNVIQLTNGGDNAEAYWSFDNKRITFQRSSPKDGVNCDQIFMGLVPINNTTPFTYKSISGGKGRTTCSYFTKDGAHIIYASTKGGGDECPPTVDRAKYGNKYIWPLYNTYDIFMADTNGVVVKQLTNAKGYDAEATLSYDGKRMIYCSDKDGDLDLYVMNLATGKEKKVTNTLGYDGGAWFSPDGKKIVFTRDGGVCQCCGSSNSLEYDHITPFSCGGSSDVSNIQLLCQKCNRSKSNSCICKIQFILIRFKINIIYSIKDKHNLFKIRS